MVPRMLPLGSINLLEWIRELSEVFYRSSQQFITKERNSETAQWKRQTTRNWEKKAELPCSLLRSLSSDLHMPTARPEVP